jgi:hypothetical protein
MAVGAMVEAFKPSHEQTQVSASVLLRRRVWWFPISQPACPMCEMNDVLDHSDRFE